MKRAPENIRINVKHSINKIIGAMQAYEPNLLGFPNIYVEDYEIIDGKLNMILLGLKIKTDCEPMLSEMSNLVSEINDKITKITGKFIFNEDGKLDKMGTIKGGDVALVSKVYFEIKEEILEIQLSFMYD